MKKHLFLTFLQKSFSTEEESMKKYAFAIVIAIFILAGSANLGSEDVTVSQETEPTFTVPKGLDTYSGLSAALAAGDNIFLYDVRTPAEYESGHIPGAVNIIYYEIARKIPVSRKKDIIVVYCVGGVRSFAAQQWLLAEGFKYVIDFGILNKWSGEIVKGPDPYISK